MDQVTRGALISLAAAGGAFLLGTVICAQTDYSTDLFGFGAILALVVGPALLGLAVLLGLVALVRALLLRAR